MRMGDQWAGRDTVVLPKIVNVDLNCGSSKRKQKQSALFTLLILSPPVCSLSPPPPPPRQPSQTKLLSTPLPRLHTIPTTRITTLLPKRTRHLPTLWSQTRLHRASLAGLGAESAARVAADEALGADVRAAFLPADGDAACFAVADDAFGIGRAEDDGACGDGVGRVGGDGVGEAGGKEEEEEERGELEGDHRGDMPLRVACFGLGRNGVWSSNVDKNP